MKTIITLIIFCLLQVNLFSQYIDANKNGKMDVYENPKENIEDRVEDLLNRMTLEEKIAQMKAVSKFQIDEKGNLPEEKTNEIKHGIETTKTVRSEDLLPSHKQ